MTPFYWLAGVLLVCSVVGLYLIVRGARLARQRERLLANHKIDAWSGYQNVSRFPPMTEKAAKGFGRDPECFRDQADQFVNGRRG